MEHRPAYDFVHSIVAANVFAEHGQIARGVKESRGVQASSALKDRLFAPQCFGKIRLVCASLFGRRIDTLRYK